MGGLRGSHRPEASQAQEGQEGRPKEAIADLGRFYDRLRAVDWYYRMADDGDAHRRGREEVAAAQREAEELGPEAVALFQAVKAACSIHDPQPMPSRPTT
jgi:uncharacterized membrane protein YccC